MKHLKKSKKIVSETLCQIKGGKIIRISRRTKRIAGVYTVGRVTKMFTMNGERKEINTPEGVVYYGHAVVQTAGMPYLDATKK